MRKPFLIRVKDFKGVQTYADLEDIDSSTELKNLIPVNGKLIKTFGYGDSAGVCPLTVASGYTVLNVYVYINENLDDGYEYIAIIQKTTRQTWVLRFNPDYNLASGEPSALLPIDADSFLVKGVAQTFNNWGGVMLSGASVTDGVDTYTFPTTFKFHIPNAVDGINTGGTIAYGDMPSELGVSTYTADDAESSAFDDTIAFNNGAIKTFSNAAGEYGVARLERAGGKTFAVTTAKFGADLPDKLWYYTTSWTQIASTDFGVTMAAGDKLLILNITEMGGDLYVVYLHYDVSDAGSQYHYRLSRLHSIATTPTWVNDLWTNDLATNILAGLTTMPHDDVKSVAQTISTVDYLFFSVAGNSTSTTCGGYLVQYDVSGGSSELTLPTLPAGGASVDLVGVAIADDKFYCFTNDTTNTNIEAYESATVLAPSWGDLALPAAVTGIGQVASWDVMDFVVSTKGVSGYNGEKFGFYPAVTIAGAPYYIFVEYDPSAGTWSGSSNSVLDYTKESIRALYFSNHRGRTGADYLVNTYSITGSKVSLIVGIAGTDLEPYSLFTGTTEYYITGLLSYELTLPDGVDADDHITSIHYLFGDIDVPLASDPSISRIVSFGANPDYTEYGGDIAYASSFDACMGWIEIFQSLDVDLEFDMYHKADKNPIVMDKQILRILPGAVGEVGANEAKGLWYGYIDRDYYDGLYSAGSEYTAGFRAYDKTPLTPDKYANTSAVGADIELTQWGTAEETYRYVRYSFIYDGVQESLLSPPVYCQTEDGVNKAVFRLKLYDGTVGSVRDSARITGIRLYSMVSASDTAVATLIGEINFTLKATERELYSATGRAALHVWISNISTAQKALITTYLAGAGAWVGHSDGSLDAYFTTIVSFEDLGDDGCLILLSTTEDFDQWNGDWHISNASLPKDNIQFSSSDNTGGYFGQNVLKDTDTDFNGLNPIGLTVASTDATGNQAFTPGVGSDELLTVTAVAKYALQIDSDSNTETSFKYHIATNPYVFYTNSTYYSLFSIIDFASPEGSTYALQGSPSIKTNFDFATISGRRLLYGGEVLDPGGENEAQKAGLGYSEKDQLDVNPVGNLIPLNDREGGGITGIADIYERPVYAMKQNIVLLDASDATPTNWTISESPHNIGNIAKRGMVSAMGSIYVVYYDGIYRLSANNLAETDQTPTERLKISRPIQDKFDLISDKTAIVGEYDQAENEVIWYFGSETWAFNVNTQQWREIETSATTTYLTIDQNADILLYDSSDGQLKTTTVSESVSGTWRSQRFAFDMERKGLIRYMTIKCESSDALTVNLYFNRSATAGYTKTISSPSDINKIKVKRWCENFEVEIVSASSTNSFELYEISIEAEE